MPSRFQILMQHARADHAAESCRPCDYDGFLAAFRGFEWLKETNQTFWARGPSPMISVHDTETDVTLSVTSHDVLSAAMSYKEPNTEGWIDFLVIVKIGEQTDVLDAPKSAFSTPRSYEVEEAYRLFFLESYESLHRHLYSLMHVTTIDHSSNG
jgi:hypothetical protein